MTEFLFIQKFYGSLALFTLAFWGLGATALKKSRLSVNYDPLLQWAISTALGMGIMILTLQAISILGSLNRPTLLTILTSSWILAAYEIWHCRSTITGAIRAQRQPWNILKAACLWSIACTLAPTLLSPLAPPLQWDELMYHLPHARQWALNGRISINDWVRYPWFPYNFDLLFSAALILKGDILAHLLHALAGWLTGLMIYRVGINISNRIVACLATIIWLSLSSELYGSAYNDLGIALMLTTAATTAWCWSLNPSKTNWLLITAFMLGLAAGSKYQALSYTPLFALATVYLKNKFKKQELINIKLLALAFSLPCMYWYVRNLIMTGNPFNPLGAQIFGYYDWNKWDLEIQLADLKNATNWPPKILWLAILSFTLPHLRNDPVWRGISIICSYSTITWLLTSHYDRYLLPTYPLISLLTTQTASDAFLTVKNKIPISSTLFKKNSILTWLFCLIITITTTSEAIKKCKTASLNIAFTNEAREDLLAQNISFYPLIKKLNQDKERRIYQIALEGWIYYLPNPIWGEMFGPWRNEDRMYLPPEKLAHRLRDENFNTLLIREDLAKKMQKQQDFDLYFHQIGTSSGAIAFDIEEPKSR